MRVLRLPGAFFTNKDSAFVESAACNRTADLSPTRHKFSQSLEIFFEGEQGLL
jgi:hypothetical protein